VVSEILMGLHANNVGECLAGSQQADSPERRGDIRSTFFDRFGEEAPRALIGKLYYVEPGDFAGGR
jgi:hypothetical protein